MSSLECNMPGSNMPVGRMEDGGGRAAVFKEFQESRQSGLRSDLEVVEQSWMKFDFGEVGRKRQ